MRSLGKSFVNKLFKWLFDIEECRSTQVYKRAIDGTPLVKFDKDSIFNTEEGIRGAIVYHNILMFGYNVELIKGVICGDFDSCLTKSSKDKLIKNISDRLASGGKCTITRKNSRGTLDFIGQKWQDVDLEEIKMLLEKHIHLE